jgi:GNAT superfamily N-acetyltransferase
MAIDWTPKRIPSWAGVYTWESQADQYARYGDPGVGYERHYADGEDKGPECPVDCLLFRGESGLLLGILNHYPEADPGGFEQAGNINIWVKEDQQGRGIGRTLVREAKKRWGLHVEQQRYSDAGLAFLKAMDRDGEL